MEQIECPHCERISQNKLEDEFCSHCGGLLAQEQVDHEDKQAGSLPPCDNISTYATRFSLIAAVFGWVGLVLYVAVLPNFEPEAGTFVLLMLPYLFFGGFTVFWGLFGSTIAIVAALCALNKNRSDKIALFSFVISFLCLCLWIYVDRYQ
jgi:hypothetical protein